MEPGKKDFSTEQLRDLLREIEQAPPPDQNSSPAEVSAALAHSLGEELEELAVFGGDSLPPGVGSEPLPVQEPSLEDWLHEVASQKIGEMVQQQNLEETINDILKQLVPPLAESLITREIEKIKEQIKDL